MENLKHTPGEWAISKGINDLVIYQDGSSTDLALVYKDSRSLPAEEAEANAKLISAAPELLASCNEWLDTWLYIRENYPQVEIPSNIVNGADACGRLRQAIQKATI